MDNSKRDLICPRCEDHVMDLRNIADITVDQCSKCKGTWYDDGELKAVLGEAYDYSKLIRNLRTVSTECLCPICGTRMTGLEFHGGGLTFVIDHCSRCRGFWLDSGELQKVQNIEYFVDTLEVKPSAFRPRPVVPVKESAVEVCASISDFQDSAMSEEKDGVEVPGTMSGLEESTHGMDESYGGSDTGSERKVSKKDIIAALENTMITRSRPLMSDPSRRKTVSSFSGDKYAEKLFKVELREVLEHYKSIDYPGYNDAESISVHMYLFCLLSQLPVEVYNPTKKMPWFLMGIITINLFFFWLESSMTLPDLVAFIMNFGAIPNKVFTFNGFYTLLTAGFIHANWAHVLINMYYLWTFGDNVNDVFYDHGEEKGPWIFVIYYLTLVVVANLVHCMLSYSSATNAMRPLVGASGGVSGILASYWRLFPNSKLYQIIFFYPFKVPIWLYIFIWVGMQFLIASYLGFDSIVSWQCHLGGFAAGYFLLPLFLPYSLDEIRNNR